MLCGSRLVLLMVLQCFVALSLCFIWVVDSRLGLFGIALWFVLVIVLLGFGWFDWILFMGFIVFVFMHYVLGLCLCRLLVCLLCLIGDCVSYCGCLLVSFWISCCFV